MKWHVRVELDDETFDGLKAYFLDIATHRPADFLAREFSEFPFQPYRPVREQLKTILRAINKARSRISADSVVRHSIQAPASQTIWSEQFTSAR